MLKVFLLSILVPSYQRWRTIPIAQFQKNFLLNQFSLLRLRQFLPNRYSPLLSIYFSVLGKDFRKNSMVSQKLANIRIFAEKSFYNHLESKLKLTFNCLPGFCQKSKLKDFAWVYFYVYEITSECIIPMRKHINIYFLYTVTELQLNNSQTFRIFAFSKVLLAAALCISILRVYSTPNLKYSPYSFQMVVFNVGIYYNY